MECNNCSNGSIIEITIDNQKMKICKSCHGIIIFDNNLKEVAKISHKIKAKNKFVKNEKRKNKSHEKDEFASYLICPNCDTAMEHFEYMYSSKIYIDRCPNCNHIWLDKGKLERINLHFDNLNSYDNKIEKLMPKLLDVTRETNATFQKIKEESNPYRDNNKK